MASGPVALCGWRFRSSLCTPSHSMLNVAIDGYGQPFIFGMLLGSSSVKTLENCWLSIAALVLESFCRSPSTAVTSSGLDEGIQLLGVTVLRHGGPDVGVVKLSYTHVGWSSVAPCIE